MSNSNDNRTGEAAQTITIGPISKSELIRVNQIRAVKRFYELKQILLHIR